MIAGIVIKLGILIVIAGVLYLLAIMPRMINRPDKTPFMGVMYAHRGLFDNRTQAPENSMTAFEKAVNAGYGIELDVQVSKDGIPVVFHDFDLSRMCGVEGKVSAYTYEELKRFRLLTTQERIPGLEEFIRMVNGKVPLIVELKVEYKDISVCAAADKLLRNYRGVYCIESFNPLALIWYRRYNNQVMRGQLSDAFVRGKIFTGALYRSLECLMFNFITKPDFIAYNHKYAKVMSRVICRKLYKSLAVAWTVRNKEELEKASTGFDLFIFDSFIP